MRESLIIFRKDVRHLWPGILMVLLFAGLEGWLNAGPLQPVILALWALSCVYLVASAVHQESLTGNQQDWLTRPIPRRSLLLAKLLLLVTFAGLPRTAAQAAALAWNGISPLRHVPLLFVSVLLFSIAVAVAAAALAAVTANFMQFLFAVLPIAAIVIVGIARGGRELDWGNVSWIRTVALGGVAFAAALAVLIVQYLRRETAISRATLALAVIAVAAGPLLGSWHAAFAVQSKLGQPVDASVAQISFDPAGPPAGPYSAEYGGFVTGIDLPVRVAGIPADARLISERTAISIEAPRGAGWTSAWTTMGGLAKEPDGAFRQRLYIDTSVYEKVKDSPVRLRSTVALTLLGDRASKSIAPQGRTGHLQGDGFCFAGQGPFAHNILVTCAWPGSAPARAYVQGRSTRSSVVVESLLSRDGTYAAFPLDGSMWSIASAVLTVVEPGELRLETWRALAHFERELDIPQIRLSDYAIRRITDLK